MVGARRTKTSGSWRTLRRRGMDVPDAVSRGFPGFLVGADMCSSVELD